MDESRLTLLVQSARGGDRTAFGKLAEEFRSSVYAIVLRRLKNDSEAQEVTQDVLARAFRKLPQLRQPGRFAGWLRQIAHRMAINRAVRGPRETLRSPECFDTLVTGPETPLDQVLQRERRRAVRDGMERLREVDRKTLLAFYFEGKSLQEMSESFHSPVGTIKRRLHTARHRLREQLSVSGSV